MAKLINIPSIIALSVFLTLLIIFDAAQQQYYVQSFDLNGSTLSFASFVLLHTVRWACWLIFTIPLVIYTWRLPNLEQPFLTSARLPSTLIYSLIMTILSIITITIISIYRQEFTLSWSLFLEFNEFFVYQKGLIFFLAHLGIILCIVNLKQRKNISSQWQEIELL